MALVKVKGVGVAYNPEHKHLRVVDNGNTTLVEKFNPASLWRLSESRDSLIQTALRNSGSILFYVRFSGESISPQDVDSLYRGARFYGRMAYRLKSGNLDFR